MLVGTWINWLATSFPPSASTGAQRDKGRAKEIVQKPRSIYLNTVLRSMPVCLAIPRRTLSMQFKDLDRLPQFGHPNPLPAMGRSIDDDAPPVFRGGAPKDRLQRANLGDSGGTSGEYCSGNDS